MESFYVSPEHISADQLVLTDEEAHHCTRVLRKKAGDEILVIDGKGKAYRAIIANITRESVECAIKSRTEGLNEPRRQVYLGISLLKHNAKFDIVVEKGTELGVCGFVPLVTERSEKQSANTRRLREIALSATKQCLRSRVPEIFEPVNLTDAFELVKAGSTVMAHEKAPQSDSFVKYLAVHASTEKLLILIGPEGGFTDAECAAAEQNGAQLVSLGMRRLRTETAAIIAAGLAAQAE
ncbi:MAG TPA: RsmE family RNA methyltransferase [Candidatus Kapabacteria bacterium]|nr:RsmE family RNA methyltransferase [Candidatus Kapabacteria bacterium]